MGSNTLNGMFYKPDIGASGAVEKGKFDDGLDGADLVIEANKPVNNKLSAFAATTSAELAGVISDEIGAGKLRFDTSVTAKTTTATLNVNEAGTILVSAAAAYTITLPTAVGNIGLTYHFIKTDANYKLITLDGDGTETINYENATGAPKLTYNRLNTYCAEVTVISDGANWQVIDEAMGQVPSCWVYLSENQLNLKDQIENRAELDTKQYDIGNNFDISTFLSGSATSTSANHLVDTGGAFVATMVGYRVKNTTDSTYAYITAYNSGTDVTLSSDIFIQGENYEIKNAQFVCPITGTYQVIAKVAWNSTSVVADKAYNSYIERNNVILSGIIMHSSVASHLQYKDILMYAFSKGDHIMLSARPLGVGVDTVDLASAVNNTSLVIRLISKD